MGARFRDRRGATVSTQGFPYPGKTHNREQQIQFAPENGVLQDTTGLGSPEEMGVAFLFSHPRKLVFGVVFLGFAVATCPSSQCATRSMRTPSWRRTKNWDAALEQGRHPRRNAWPRH
eukprot:scaffold6007_cov183-Amphora_coffeaeformis.AAC.3